MSFHRRGNRREQWATARDARQDLIARTALPPALFESESRLEAFLTYGRSDDPGADLTRLTDEQFRALKELADAVLPDNRDVWALTNEVQRRRAGYHPPAGLADEPAAT